MNEVIDYQYQELLQNHAGDKSEQPFAKLGNKERLKHTLESSEL